LNVDKSLLVVVIGVKVVGQGSWKQEPTSFLGVTFGKPLSTSYPECPKNVENGRVAYTPLAGATCWERGGNCDVLIRPGEFFDIYVQSIDGNVANISASFKHSDFPKISKELIGEYGEPQWRNYPPMSMKDGSTLPSEGLNWFGKDIQFFCMSQPPTQGEGMLGMNNRAWEKLIERISRE
jgi:hypothetical protein